MRYLGGGSQAPEHPLMALRDILRCCTNSVAIEAKRTLRSSHPAAGLWVHGLVWAGNSCLAPFAPSSLICLSSPGCKNIFVSFRRKSYLCSLHPVPGRGALAIVTNVGMGCGGREGVERNSLRGRTMFLRTAKPCGPDAPTLASSWRRCSRIAPAMVATKPGHQGERGGNR